MILGMGGHEPQSVHSVGLSSVGWRQWRLPSSLSLGLHGLRGLRGLHGLRGLRGLSDSNGRC
jgi:hypothetical protein